MDQALRIHHPDIAREKNIRPGLCPASDAKELSSMSSLSRKEHRVMLHTAHLSKSMPKGPNNHNPSGILGTAGLLLEFKHGIPELCAPFADCTSLWEGLMILMHMDDNAFLGLVLWVAILVASLVATAKWLLALAK